MSELRTSQGRRIRFLWLERPCLTIPAAFVWEVIWISSLEFCQFLFFITLIPFDLIIYSFSVYSIEERLDTNNRQSAKRRARCQSLGYIESSDV